MLRWPAPPYLLVGDLAALALSRAVGWSVHPTDFACLVVLLVCFQMSGLYRSRLKMSLLDDFPALLGGSVAAAASTLSLSALTGGAGSRGLMLAQAGALLVFVLVIRRLAYTGVRWARVSGRVRHATLVLGAGHVGIRIAEQLLERREHGLDPVGFIDGRPRTDGATLPAPLFGSHDQLAGAIRAFSVKVVIVAFGSMKESELVDVLRTCDRLRTDIIFVPRLFEVHSATRDTDDLDGLPLVRARRAAYRSMSWQLKRAFDIVFSLGAIIAVAPVMLACAIAVRWEGGPGIIFRQERVGVDGRSFELRKFRSLKPATSDESAVKWNIAHDHRLGPVGRFLRQTSLDELPQLFNILSGDMSIVGPRPERPHFVSEFSTSIPRYMARHRVPSGLTGWAQVNGLRGDTSITERARFDNYYIENWSLWTDFKIILRTIGQVTKRQGG